MSDDRWAVARIERALDERPYCSLCGRHMTVIADRDAIWAVCSAREAPRTLLERIGATLFPHDRIHLLDMPIAA